MSPAAPRLVLVIGTATDIGKTWVGRPGAGAAARTGTAVAARKPAQSADADDPGPSDAEVLGGGSGEPPEDVCPAASQLPDRHGAAHGRRAFRTPVPTLDDLLAELTWPTPRGRRRVARDGGRPPVPHRGRRRRGRRRRAPRPRPGAARRRRGPRHGQRRAPLAGPVRRPPRCVTFLNRFDPADDLHQRNLDWLRSRERLEVVVDLEALTAVVAGAHPRVTAGH
jgi:dethiobiotin synthetase